MQFSDLIGIAGYKESGKDEVAKVLDRGGKGHIKFAFADPLRDEVLAMLCAGGIPAEAYRAASSEVLAAVARQTAGDWNQKFRRVHEKPTSDDMRLILQWWGTEWRRQYFDVDYWLRAWRARRPHLAPTVVPDVRFENEVGLIRQLGGEVWVVRRAAVVPADIENLHPSERLPSLPDAYFDRVIQNNGSLEDLAREVMSAGHLQRR